MGEGSAGLDGNFRTLLLDRLLQLLCDFAVCIHNDGSFTECDGLALFLNRRFGLYGASSDNTLVGEEIKTQRRQGILKGGQRAKV